MKPFFFILLSFLFFAVGNCFEYEETIHFKKGFSGFVEVTYTVPLQNKGDNSLIRFLPTSATDIETRINKNIFTTKHSVRDYAFQHLEPNSADDSLFKRKGKVSYKIDFQDLAELDGIILGNIINKTKGRSITVRREFPSLILGKDEALSVGERRVVTESLKLLKSGSLTFRVLFPQTSECFSNKGFVNLGFLQYTLPLTETLESGKAIAWEYKINLL